MKLFRIFNICIKRCGRHDAAYISIKLLTNENTRPNSTNSIIQYQRKIGDPKKDTQLFILTLGHTHFISIDHMFMWNGWCLKLSVQVTDNFAAKSCTLSVTNCKLLLLFFLNFIQKLIECDFKKCIRYLQHRNSVDENIQT